MLTGMIHSHSGLGYLLLLVAGIAVALAGAGVATGAKPGLVRAGAVVSRRVIPALMGINGLIGLGLWWVEGWGLATWRTWVGFFALAANGMLAGKGHKPTFLALTEGQPVASRWLMLTVIDLVIIVGTFGAMHMGKPG